MFDEFQVRAIYCVMIATLTWRGSRGRGGCMPVTFDIGPMVRKYSAIPFERLELIRDITVFHLSEIDRASRTE